LDFDYKGLANAGTWFIGRLQTENDKDRLMGGLTGVGGNIDLDQVYRQIASLKKRHFLMHDVHESGPVLMQSRWAMSYLRGPLTRQQIKQLMDEKRGQAVPAEAPIKSAGKVQPASSGTSPGARPPLPAGVSEQFLPVSVRPSGPGRLVYHPAVAALGQAAIFDNRLGLSSSESLGHCLELGEESLGLLWDKASPCPVKPEALAPRPEEEASFLPPSSRAAQFLKTAEGDYGDFVARTVELSLWKSRQFGEVSRPGETERDFRLRLGQLAREKRDAEVERLRQRYAAKFATLERQLLTAQQRLQREQEQYKGQMAQTTISIGATILGSILGRKVSQIGRATTSARSASRAYYEKMDIDRAKQQVEVAQTRRAELEKQVEVEATRITNSLDPNTEVLQPIVLRPKKKDIMVQWSGLLWLPFWHLESGAVEAGFRLGYT